MLGEPGDHIHQRPVWAKRLDARAGVAFIGIGGKRPEFDGRQIALHHLHDLVFARTED